MLRTYCEICPHEPRLVCTNMPGQPLKQSKLRVPIHFEVGRMSVEFIWNSDRWHHFFRKDQKDCMQSVEGDKIPTSNDILPIPIGISERWPASPVITEVTPTEAMGHRALVAVGLAGRSHFSASLTASTAKKDTILVEVACRIYEAPEWLGSTYSCNGKGPRDTLLTIKPGVPEPLDLPSTVLWSYCVSVGGIEAVHPASCGRLLFPSNC